MRAETRHSLKEDRFRVSTLQAAERTAHWTVEHRTSLMVALAIVLVVVAAGFGTWSYLTKQDQRASIELGQATRIMEAPIRPAGAPAQPDAPTSYASLQERSAAAQKELQSIVDKYPHTHTADIARYMLGVTSTELGNNAQAEKYLSEVASIHNKDLAALANFALAAVYRKEGKDAQAIALYKQLIDKPAQTVGKITAQMELASLYQSKQQIVDAKNIYQQIQKDNPATEAASLASQKLAQLK
ncbi:MAG TPA: tetratricopeptide repeat protein [Terriglobales bacterium]|nr:tetratricopeptide repeat protein [Terriglobales bacterium]